MFSIKTRELAILVAGFVICFVAACVTWAHVSTPPTKSVVVSTTSISGKHQDPTIAYSLISKINNLVSDDDNFYVLTLSVPDPSNITEVICDTIVAVNSFGFYFDPSKQYELYKKDLDGASSTTEDSVHVEKCHIRLL